MLTTGRFRLTELSLRRGRGSNGRCRRASDGSGRAARGVSPGRVMDRDTDPHVTAGGPGDSDGAEAARDGAPRVDVRLAAGQMWATLGADDVNADLQRWPM